VWLTFLLLTSDFCHRTSALLSSSSAKLKQTSLVLEFQKRRRTVVSVFDLFHPDSGGREETLPSPQLSF
jgi:hypothetical protein